MVEDSVEVVVEAGISDLVHLQDTRNPLEPDLVARHMALALCRSCRYIGYPFVCICFGDSTPA